MSHLPDSTRFPLCSVNSEEQFQKVSFQWWLEQLDAGRAWGLGATGRGVRVAVIDAGFDLAHPDLTGTGKVDGAATIVDGKAVPGIVNHRIHRHGNGVAGLICASAEDYQGIAPEATLVPIACEAHHLGVNDVHTEVAAFQWALDQEADVVCCAWGPRDASGAEVRMDARISRALEKLVMRNTIVIFAAGNGRDGVDLDGWAGHPAVLAIGACDEQGQRLPRSEYGRKLFCLAPGGGSSPVVSTGNSRYVTSRQVFGGTSAAAAMVAGISALVKQTGKQLDWGVVRNILAQSCEKTVHRPGEGPYVEGRSQEHGYGQIQAARAVELTQQAVEKEY